MSEKSCIKLLKNYGLKPTKQRIIITKYIFSGSNMHFCAEDLRRKISKKGFRISLATIYNNLHHFANKGLLKTRKISNSITYFDNNITDHYHFYDSSSNNLIDIPSSAIKFLKLPKLPKNKKIKNMDLVIHIENK